MVLSMNSYLIVLSRPSRREMGGMKPVLETGVSNLVVEQNFFMRMELMGYFLPVIVDARSNNFPAR